MNMILTPEERQEMTRRMRGRILNVLPAATYQMDRFLGFVDVVVSDSCDSACVEIGPQPRMHLNGDFIEQYCQRDEHLLMLVMHELYHIILGHTRLFPRATRAHNIAFDAVINALLCHQFTDPIYLDFFRQLNSCTEFPGRLLRPPEGWPGDVRLAAENISTAEKAVMNLLYRQHPSQVTYQEILDLLKEELSDQHCEETILLGDHDGSGLEGINDKLATSDQLLRDVLRQTTDSWPEKADLTKDRGEGGSVFDALLPNPKYPHATFLKALKRLLDRAGIFNREPNAAYTWKAESRAVEFRSPLPNWRDRSVHAHKSLWGQAPLLYTNDLNQNKLRWTPRDTTHIYLDISGSMNQELPWLVAALDPLNKKGLCKIFVFSTVVDEVRQGRLTVDGFKDTGGTNINCVYEHLVKLPRHRTPRRVVVLTDGYTGIPHPDLANECKKKKVDLYVGITNGSDRDLKPYAKIIEMMPPYRA